MLHKWLQAASRDEKQQFARRARTSLAYIYHIAKGSRLASADTAANIERASEEMQRYNDTLPIITRGDINRTCRVCPYFKKHCGGK